MYQIGIGIEGRMGWKSTGRPTVRQSDKWVVRVDGIDTESGKDRPRLGLRFGPAHNGVSQFASRKAAMRISSGGRNVSQKPG